MTPAPSEERCGPVHDNWAIAQRSKQTLLDTLGPFCRICCETDPVVLLFDHPAQIHRGGAKRRSAGVNSLLSNLRGGRDDPFNVQVLCANCHMRKTRAERMRN